MFIDELNKILMSGHPSDGIRNLVKNGKIGEFMPEVISMIGFEQKNPHHDKDVFEHTMVVVDSAAPDLTLRMAALLHDIGKPQCFTVDDEGIGHFKGHHILSAEIGSTILNRLKYDNKFADDVVTLIRFHYVKGIDMSKGGICKFVDDIGAELFDNMFLLIEADIKGKARSHDFETVRQIRMKCMEYMNLKYAEKH